MSNKFGFLKLTAVIASALRLGLAPVRAIALGPIASAALLPAAVAAVAIGGCSTELSVPTARIVTGAGDAGTIAVGAKVELDGSTSSDPNGEALAYRWRLVSSPAGSRATIAATDATSTWILPDVSGDYTVELLVSDGALTSAPVTATFSAGPCGGGTPTVRSIVGDPATPTAGDAVLLSADVTDPDLASSCGVSEQLTYAWSLVELPPGSHATLNLASSEAPSLFTDEPGSYHVRLVVTDAAGHAGASDSTIDVAGCPTPDPNLVSVAASPAEPITGVTVSLSAVVRVASGGSSSGADGGGGGGGSEGGAAPAPAKCTPHFAYHWTLVSVPPGSTASLVDSPVEDPSFVADVPGDYGAELFVTNTSGRESAVRQVTVHVATCGSSSPVAKDVQVSPASAAVGQPAALTVTVTDADTTGTCGLAEQFTYAWSITGAPAGGVATLNDAAFASPSLTANVAGTYGVSVVVTDSEGHESAPATGLVVVNACGSNAPVVSAVTASPFSPNTGATVALSATASDADAAAPCNLPGSVVLTWSLTSVPVGSRAALSGIHQTAPWFLADVPGAYVVEVRGTDSSGLTGPAKATTITATACGSNAPVAHDVKASPASAATNQPVALTVTVDDADAKAACGIPEHFTYAWSVTSAPAGATATLNDAALAGPSLIADVAGTYGVSVVVTDSEGHVSAVATGSAVVSACGSAAPSVTRIAVGPASPIVGAGVSFAPSVTDSDMTGTCNMKEAFSYAWDLVGAPSGSVATLTTTTSSLTGLVPDKVGVYTVSLVVTDSEGNASAPAMQTVTVASAVTSTCGSMAPVARLASVTAGPCGPGPCTATTTSPAVTSPPNATPPGYTITLNGHTSVKLDGSSSFDADNQAPCSAGQTLSYTWSILTAPVGSKASFAVGSGPTSSMVAPTFLPDVTGLYQVSLVVSDGVLTSQPLVVQIGL